MKPADAAAKPMPVAIVGIGCRFPGGIVDPTGFWRLLREGVDAIAEIPRDRIDLDRYFDRRPATPGRIMTRWGGFLERIDELDAYFFGISPREAERLDPQQRLLLETAWEALEDAGQDVGRLEGSQTGVFVGQWLSDFEGRLFADPEAVDFYMTTGSGRYAASGRLSYVLGLRGPSLTLDTACSSSLVAVHLAVRSIRSGESRLALAGGVNVILQPHISIAYSQSRMMAPDGRCKFGDVKGDGYVRSEGAGLVVLKPLAAALADGDRVYAVIRGSAINNDGRSSGSMGTPSRIGQEELLRTAYGDAAIPANRVGYVEAHGTGTRAGDPVELGALGVVLAEGRAPGHRAAVGSVKSNFGHTEGAAGVAGLIKVALALHHRTIPPSLHCHELNPAIAWDSAPFEIPRSSAPWPAGETPRVGGVSAFGIAGTNAHVVLEEAPDVVSEAETTRVERPVAVLPLSAKSPEALRALASRYADVLGGHQAPELNDLCWSAASRRTPLAQRAAFVATDAAALADALRRYASGEAATAEGTAPPGAPPRIAFVFPGQGAQWTGMARELMAREPVFRDELVRCDAAARPWIDWSILEQLGLEPGAAGYRLDQIDAIQPVLVALAIAYAALWRSLGVEPDAVVGHSMGEVGAAYVAGVLDLGQAMRIICRRSALMRRTSGQGAMALVELSMDEARARVSGREDRLSVAVSNSPRSSVISGEPQAVQEVLAELERDQVFCRLVKVDVASHSPQMDPLAAELRAELADLTPSTARVPLYSTVLAARAEGHSFGAGYWADNLRRPVLFGATVSRLVEDGVTVFVELGPHPILLPSIQQTAQALDRPAATIACGRREEPEQASLLAGLGGLWAAGCEIDWRTVMPGGGRVVALPLYPWQRERHWIDAAQPGAEGPARRRAPAQAAGPRHPLLGTSVDIGGRPPGRLWEPEIDVRRAPYLAEHRLHGVPMLAASVYVELALAAARALGAADDSALEALTFEQPLYLQNEAPALQLRALPDGSGLALAWHSYGETGWVRHAAARLAPSAGRSTSHEPPPPADLLRSGPALTGAALYAQLETRGAAFGAPLRSIKRAWMGEGTALAELETPAGEGPATENFEIAPAALDACFQLAVATLPGEELWLPSGLARVRRFARTQAPQDVVTRAGAPAADGSRSVDVVLRGADGPILELEGLRLQRLAGDVPLDPRQWLFDVRWTAEPRAAAPSSARAFVLVADRAGVGDALSERLRESGALVTVVAPDVSLDDHRTLEILSEQAARGPSGRPVEVVYLRGLDLGAPTGETASALHGMVRMVHGLDRFDAAPRRGWVVTRGARSVQPHDGDALAITQAPLWGLGAAAAEEHPTLWGGCLDLDPAMAPPDVAAWLHDEITGPGGDAALRGGERFVPRLSRLEASDDIGAVSFRADATYLLTGGLGGIGVPLARWMVEHGARRLAVLGRTTLPPRSQWSTVDPASRQARALEAVRALESVGASVHYASVDVSDEGQLRGFLDTFRTEGWPAIRGVFHAAGVIDDRLLSELDAASLASVMGAKMLGSWHLDRLLPELDQFVLFSSVAALLAQPGQASYAAANAFLDALAHRRRGRGQAALSVNWGVWQDVGFAGTEGGAQARARLARLGIEAFPVGAGLDALGQLLALATPQAAVLPLDARALRQAQEAGTLSRVATTLLAPLAGQPGATASGEPATSGSVSEQLLREDPVQRRVLLEERLTRHAASILRLAAARLDRRTALGSYGLTSLLALELRNRIEADLGLPLSATLLWSYPTVTALAEHLLTRLAPESPAPPVAAPQGPGAHTPARPVDQVVENIESLSDAAALAALAGARRRGGR